MKKRLALFLSLLMLLAVFTGCGSKDTGTPDSQNGGSQSGTTPSGKQTDDKKPSRDTLRMAVTETFLSTDPHFRSLIVDSRLTALTYERFFYVNDSMELIPQLAESYEVSEDGRVYTYHMIKGAKFHNGEEVRAIDAVDSYKRAQTSPTQYDSVEFIDKVEALDDYTVQITLTQISPTFDVYANYVAIVSEKAVTGAPDKYEVLPAGSGPYTIETWKGDEKVVLKRFPDYHGDAPAIETIEYIVLGDTSSALMAFEAGEIDYFSIPKAEWPRISESGLYTTRLMQSAHTTFMCFNVNKAPFTDVRVRQAFNYAVNKDDVLLGALDNLGVVASQIGVPDLCFGCPTPEQTFTYEYNPEKAKELLAEAGYPDGLTLPEKAGTMAGNHFQSAIEVIQAQLADVGVQFDIEIVDSAVYGDRIRSGNFLFQVWGISLSPDASSFRRVYGTGGDLNGSLYSNSRIDELFDMASRTVNSEEREKYFFEIYNIANEEAAYLPLYWQKSCYAWNKDLNADPDQLAAKWSWK